MRLAPAVACALLVAACGSTPAPSDAPAPSARSPDGCGKDYPADAPLLTLDKTRAPKEGARKDQPFQFANQIKVGKSLAGEGQWVDFNDGWSMLALRVTSPDAKSMALHLTQLKLPGRAQVWFCSADGRFKQGPYREAAGGELWTPVVLGAEAKLQIDVPTRDRAAFTGQLAEAFGGFR